MTDNYNREKKTISFHSYDGTIYSYSDGIKELMEKYNVPWLVETIYINCHYDENENPRFQIWRYTRELGPWMASQCTDGFTGELLQANEFLNDDMPATFSIWIFEGDLMLPSEFVQVCL